MWKSTSQEGVPLRPKVSSKPCHWPQSLYLSAGTLLANLQGEFLC